MLFGWETVMTFVLVSVVYAVAIGEPSFGIMGPFAIGLALFTMVFSGEFCIHNCCAKRFHSGSQHLTDAKSPELSNVSHQQVL